jgi:signal transduction histidine kinase
MSAPLFTAETVRSAVGGTIITSPDGVIRMIGGDLPLLTGLAPTDAVGRHVRDLLDAGDAPPLLENECAGHCLLSVRDGRCRPMSFLSTRLVDVDGRATGWCLSLREEPCIGDSRPSTAPSAWREVEEANRRLCEEQAKLAQSEKLAGIGQLAAGIAHEINNPMTFVTLNLEMLREQAARLRADLGVLRAAVEARSPERVAAECQSLTAAGLDRRLDEADHLLQRTQVGARRVKEIVQGLLAYARRDDAAAPRPTNVNDEIRAAIAIVWNELRQRATLVEELDRLPPVMAAHGSLTQVFVNLLLNAVQACPDGRITIESLASETHVLVRVSDNGSGIAPEHLSRLFTPFFTTKPPGAGTGLGLFVSYQIVHRAGGTIEAESTPGQGATFTVYLPRHDA